MFRLIRPNLRIASVTQLTLARLGDLGLESLLLDVDCTLKRYRETEVSAEVAAWLEELRAGGIALCLASNGRDGRIGRFAETLGLPFVAPAFKPLPFRLKAAARKLEFPMERTAMVGDQVFADVIAGRLAGLSTVLIDPIHPEEEPWYTRIKRPLERLLVRRVINERVTPREPNP